VSGVFSDRSLGGTSYALDDGSDPPWPDSDGDDESPTFPSEFVMLFNLAHLLVTRVCVVAGHHWTSGRVGVAEQLRTQPCNVRMEMSRQDGMRTPHRGDDNR